MCHQKNRGYVENITDSTYEGARLKKPLENRTTQHRTHTEYNNILSTNKNNNKYLMQQHINIK